MEELKLIVDSINASNFIEKEIAKKMTSKLKSTCIGKNEYFEAAEKGRENYDKYFGKEGIKVDGAYEIDVRLARKNKIFPME